MASEILLLTFFTGMEKFTQTSCIVRIPLRPKSYPTQWCLVVCVLRRNPFRSSSAVPHPSFIVFSHLALPVLIMVLLRSRVHPRGLSLAQQRKVYVRRTVHKESWQKIAPQTKNLQGTTPGWPVCRDIFKRMLGDA